LRERRENGGSSLGVPMAVVAPSLARPSLHFAGEFGVFSSAAAG
jgi:hypothetical protein